MASRTVITGPSYVHCPQCGHALHPQNPGGFGPETRQVALVHESYARCVDAALTFYVLVQRVECEVDE